MVLNTIRDMLPKLPAAQRELAQFILERPAEAAFFSSHDLAARTAASPSTVVRLSRSLGYSGFPSFQSALQQMLIERLKSTTRLYSTLDERDDETMLESFLQADIAALQAAMELISPQVFHAVARLLATARRVFLVGLGISSAVVHVLAFRLRRTRLDVHPVTQGGADLLDALFAVQAGDVVVAIAFQRIRPEILMAMEFARSREATLVAFAEDPLSHHALLADHVLLTRRGPAETLNSLAVPMAVTNALCLAVSKHRAREAALAYHWVDEFKQKMDTLEDVAPTQHTTGAEQEGPYHSDEPDETHEDAT